MKILIVFFISFTISLSGFAQNVSDKDLVHDACMDYLNGFYNGDTSMIIKSFKPSLHKFGYWKDDKSGKFGDPISMTFEGAKKYANNVKEQEKFPDANAPKKVEVLDVMSKIAAAKVTAWWGTDYLLLSKEGSKWMIEQVIWEGPLSIPEK